MKKYLPLLLTFFIGSGLFAVERVIPLENNTGTLHLYTLPNGFTLFVKEDPSMAVSHIAYLCRAGYSFQDAENAGLFELYSRLFLQSAASPLFELLPVQASCAADRASYTADVSNEFFMEYIAGLARCVIRPSFSDKAINAQYTQMKADVIAYTQSDVSFINSAIESRLFPNAPWKLSSGIQSSVFTAYTATQLRTKLSAIRNAYYTPDNGALFVSGSLDAQTVYDAVAAAFADWHGSYGGTTVPAAVRTEEAHRKFVLSSPNFSPELAQIVVQFTDLSAAEAVLAATIFDGFDSAYKTEVLSNPITAIRSKEYLSISTAQEQDKARLILQAVMEAPYSFVETEEEDAVPQEAKTPVDQAELFIAMARNSAVVTKENLRQAKKELRASYLMDIGRSDRALDLLADYWVRHAQLQKERFYAYYLNNAYQYQGIQEASLAETLRTGQPYVFLLLNSTVYESNKAAFTQAGYKAIGKEDAAWYKDKSYTSFAAPEKTSGSLTYPTDPDLFLPRYYAENVRTIHSGTLKNGIPLTVKSNPHSQTVTLSLAISGGELASPAGEHYLRTILINAFANCIQSELSALRRKNSLSGTVNIQAWTKEHASYITISCLKEELAQVLQAATDAIIYGELPPLLADHLIGEQNFQWRRKTSALAYQLRSATLRQLYKDSPFARLYDDESPILEQTDYQSISLTYTELLDASLYSLVIVGDIDAEDATAAAERTIGVLKQQTARQRVVIPAPHVSPQTYTVQLRHTYTTDRDAASAPADSPELVPTQRFRDPMQYYFPAPQDEEQRELFNALLYEMAARIEQDFGEGYPCQAEAADAIIPLGILQAENLLHKNSFASSYAVARRALITDLGSDAAAPAALRTIKGRWQYHALLPTQTNEGTAQLLQDGLLSGMATRYLEDYRRVEQASAQDVLKLLRSCFPEEPPIKAYSADSQR